MTFATVRTRVLVAVSAACTSIGAERLDGQNPSAVPAGVSVSARTCPVVNGLTVTTSLGDSAGAAPRVVRPLRLEFDTTFDFNIAERRWSRPFFAASIAAGVAGPGTGSGTTTAADSSAHAGLSACVGVSIAMVNPTLYLKGVRGRLHWRADVSALTRYRAATDTTRRGRVP